MDAVTVVPEPRNEPVRRYGPGSPERASLERRLVELAGERAELTMTIDGVQRMGGGDAIEVVQPHRRRHVLGVAHNATNADGDAAVTAAERAATGWRELPFEERAAIFLRAADLLAGPWRDTLNGATMLGQSKSVQQAEIDSACELIDFLRYNVHFARKLLAEQPLSSPGMWNRFDHRPLEGFVYVITPFNFTAIAGNLPTSVALLGNTVIWKPSPTQQLAAHYTMRLLAAAWLPPATGSRTHPRARWSPGVPPTTARAGSSGRRWWSAPTRRTRCSRRSTSGRSSVSTCSTTTASKRPSGRPSRPHLTR